VHVLVEDLGIFGVRIQYWMLIAIAMVAVAILFRDHLQDKCHGADRNVTTILGATPGVLLKP